MDGWNALEFLVLGVILLPYFVPVVNIPPPPNCTFGCPVEPEYGSFTYILPGHGGFYAGTHVGRILDWVIAREAPANPTRIAGSNPA
jgi:hypothetical protein